MTYPPSVIYSEAAARWSAGRALAALAAGGRPFAPAECAVLAERAQQDAPGGTTRQ